MVLFLEWPQSAPTSLTFPEMVNVRKENPAQSTPVEMGVKGIQGFRARRRMATTHVYQAVARTCDYQHENAADEGVSPSLFPSSPFFGLSATPFATTFRLRE
jgi:hypothetical protein